eukprot:1931538-Prymnesium_polylepis.1
MWEREARLSPNRARMPGAWPGVGLSVRIVFFFFFLALEHRLTYALRRTIALGAPGVRYVTFFSGPGRSLGRTPLKIGHRPREQIGAQSWFRRGYRGLYRAELPPWRVHTAPVGHVASGERRLRRTLLF